MANKSITDEKAIKALERRKKAVDFRRMGKTYRQIAAVLGISKGSVHKTVTKALTELKADISADAKLLQTQELDRLDHLQFASWTQAMKGDPQAGAQILRVMERRAKILGIDQPDKHALTNPDGTEAYQPDSMGADERQKRIAELEKKLGRGSDNPSP